MLERMFLRIVQYYNINDQIKTKINLLYSQIFIIIKWCIIIIIICYEFNF